MRSAIHRCLAILLVFYICMSSANAQVAREPLTDSKLIALVADNALGENIVHEIATRGLAFKADGAQGPQLYRRRDDAHLIVIRRRPTLDLTAIPLPYLITIVAILAVLLIAVFKRAAEKRDHERAEQESDHHRAGKEILVEKVARA